MSFLVPLYALGIASIALPFIFHLIRRTPRGRYAFSSLMFLTPSPPRLTRRSRIDNLFLLLLRGLALTLLALAFTRPFLREAANLSLGSIRGRRIEPWKRSHPKQGQLLQAHQIRDFSPV